MNKSIFWTLFIPFIVICAGGLGFHFYKPNSVSIGDVSTTNAQVMPMADRNETQNSNRFNSAETNVLSEVSENQFIYQAWSVDESTEPAKACFEFSKPVKNDGNILLTDYIRSVPEVSLSVILKESALCASGFDYGTSYEVTLLKGLPSAISTLSLASDVKIDLAFEDRPPYVAFSGEGIILPRVNVQGLGIETINVSLLSVEIARVGERMIVRRNPQEGIATPEGSYGWEYTNSAKNIRSVIWSGEIPIEAKKNQKVTSVIPLTDLTGPLEPGAYVVTVERSHTEDERRPARAWRWVISTDMALTTYRDEAGLSVSVRSIDSALPQAGVRLNLLARNNEILQTQTTDKQGIARFLSPILKGQNEKTPKMIMAYSDAGDYAVHDLTRSPLDVSEYNISGRTVKHSTDIYGFPDRGVYRPGETANLTFLFRDENGEVAPSQAATLAVKRPDGLEVYSERVTKETVSENGGALIWSYTVPKSAQRGVWTILLSQDGFGEISRVQISVEDFVPAKLRVSVEVDTLPMRRDTRRDFIIDSQFLYGAAGSGLEGEAEARIRIDPKPFKDFPDYIFGSNSASGAQNFEEHLILLGGGITDGAGKLPLSLDLKNHNIRSNHPLRAEVTLGVAEPGGRYIRDSVRLPIRTQDFYPGLKPSFTSRRASRHKPAEFSVVVVDPMGMPVSQDVSWQLSLNEWDYQWYRENGNWRYRRDVRTTLVDSGDMTVQAGVPALWSKRLSWGDYELEVKSKDDTVASYTFSVGWGQSSKTDTPDSLQIAGPSEPVKAGDPIKLTLNAPYAGQASLVIADQSIRMVKNIAVPQGGSEIEIPFDKEWGQSVYAMVSVYTPRDSIGRPVPRRAIGISYVERDRSHQKLDVKIKTDSVLRPRQTHSFTVNVKNVPRGETVWMNFAAVDEGILRLTKYKSPDASAYFLGKKAFGLNIRDDYARILNANLGAPAIAKSGGDSLGGEGLTTVPTKTVALFNGPVQVIKGTAKINLDIPDFNGELRLMATAWTNSAVGSVSRPVTVRDPVPAILGMPRFLAPGDRAFATVSLDNIEGPVGTYNAVLSTQGKLTGGGALSFSLDRNERREDRIELFASETGVDNLTLNVTGAGRYKAVSEVSIEVRSPFRPITNSDLVLLKPGESLTLNSERVSDFIAESTDVSVTFSPMAGLDATPYVQSLWRYPYGCTEQTVSTAIPLLYVKALGGFNDQTEAKTREGVKRAIDKLISRQGADGAFGLWSVGDGYARPWLGVYVSDFLYRAQEYGYSVPPKVQARAFKALRKITEMPNYASDVSYDFSYGVRYGNPTLAKQLKAEAAAYAHYVLARSERGELSKLRYLFDTHSETIKTPLAQAYLGAALSLMGDTRRAQLAFEKGLKDTNIELDYDYYQTPLRDLAGYIAVKSEVSEAIPNIDTINRFLDLLKSPEALHTQEKAYVILAINRLRRGEEAPSLSIENLPDTHVANQKHYDMSAVALSKSPKFTNESSDDIWVITTINGLPKNIPEPRQDGFNLEKTVLNKDGTPFIGGNIKQGESLIVKLEFASKIDKDRTLILADLLPAGFEIETVLKAEDGNRRDGREGAYSNLGKLSNFSIAEARDDRFIASVQSDGKENLLAAYIIRAVTPGDYIFPGAVLEDMYRPADMALTKASRITIANNPTF